jgi:hypothetical protein
MKKLIIVIGLSLFLLACSRTKDGDADEFSEFHPVLMEYYGDVIRQNCTFSLESYNRLYRKPEFAPLRDGNICEGTFEIRNVEFVADDSVQLEFRVSYTANRPVLQNFFNAWDDLVKRYETLDSLRIPDHRYGHAWTYIDPTDNDLFVRFPDEPGGIFGSRHWEQLESVKISLQEFSDDRIVYSDVYSVIIVRNDVWEIVEEIGTDGYPEDIHR